MIPRTIHIRLPYRVQARLSRAPLEDEIGDRFGNSAVDCFAFSLIPHFHFPQLEVVDHAHHHCLAIALQSDPIAQFWRYHHAAIRIEFQIGRTADENALPVQSAHRQLAERLAFHHPNTARQYRQATIGMPGHRQVTAAVGFDEHVSVLGRNRYPALRIQRDGRESLQLQHIHDNRLVTRSDDIAGKNYR